MIAEYTVPWVAVENPHGPGLAARWITSKDAPAASSGSCTWSGLVATKQDDELNLAEIEELLNKVASGMGKAQNRVRHTMNGFVIAAGVYVKPLSAKALAAAR